MGLIYLFISIYSSIVYLFYLFAFHQFAGGPSPEIALANEASPRVHVPGIALTLAPPLLLLLLLFLCPRAGIEIGNGLPELEKPSQIADALKQAGFEIIDNVDVAKNADAETPWYLSLSGSFSLTGTRSLSLPRCRHLRATRSPPSLS